MSCLLHQLVVINETHRPYLLAGPCKFIGDHEKAAVPISFPGSIELVPDPNGREEAIINPKYRQYGNANNEEFYYFLSRILSAINPACSNFRQRKQTDLISDIFSVTDEAFGLIVIYNEYHVWENLRSRKIGGGGDATVLKKRKRYCDANSGRRDGWMKEGQVLFDKLCRKVHDLREKPETGRELEEMIRKRFKNESGKYDENDSISNNSSVVVHESYKSGALLALFEDMKGETRAL